MYERTQTFQNQIIPKKANKIDCEDNLHNNKKSKRRIFKELCCAFSRHSPSTIHTLLIANNFSKTQTISTLNGTPPDKPNEEEERSIEQFERERESEMEDESDGDSSTDNSEVDYSPQ
jgi:hypothetical protein